MATTPAIPNTDRIVSYSPVVPTTDFIIPWPVIADSEILAEDDLVVIINGATLTTAQFSFAGNVVVGLSGIWNGGTVTLATAVSGVRVIIYSKRDPRRTGNFLEGKALPFTTLDKLGDDATVQVRDLALGVGRSFKTSATDYFDNGDAEMSFTAATLESVVAAFLAGISPSAIVAGWARTLSTAKALYAAPIVLANGHTISVGMRTAVGDGYGGMFTYDSTDVASTFSQDALGFVDNQNRRFKRVVAAGTFALASWFGVVADGATDDLTALQASVTTCRAVLMDAKNILFNGTLVIPANTKLMGCGPATKISGNNVIKMDVSVANVVLSDFSFIGDGSEVIQIGKNGAASNVIIERVHFVPTIANHLDRCVSIYTATNVRVLNCNFVSTGYGVITEATYTSSNLKVLNCYFSDMYGDAVLLNAAGGVNTDTLIDGNTFMGSHAGVTTEKRFVGITDVNSVVISNNFIQSCVGDSAIHLEASGGRTTILNNHLIDCGVSAGNDGYIYILNSGKTVIITNNWFVRTQPSAGTAFISTQSGAYTNEMLIQGNHFKDSSGHNAIALNLASHGGLTLVKGNYCAGCAQFVQVINADGIEIDDNVVQDTNYGVYSSNVGVASGAGGSNIEVRDNTFYCLTNSIRTGKNLSGTNGPVSWLVEGNAFKTGDVLGAGGTDILMTGNKAGSGLVNFTMASGPVARCVEAGLNFKDGTGVV